MSSPRDLAVLFFIGVVMLCGSCRLHAQEGMPPAPYVLLRPSPQYAAVGSRRGIGRAKLPVSHKLCPTFCGEEPVPAAEPNQEAVEIAFPWTNQSRQSSQPVAGEGRRNQLSAVPTGVASDRTIGSLESQDQANQTECPSARNQAELPAKMTVPTAKWRREFYYAYRDPYAYGWFGAGRGHSYRSRSYGYYGHRITWTFD